MSAPSRPSRCDPPACLRAGDLLAGRYRLRRPLGAEGAGGRLWQAVDEVLERPVAARTLPATVAQAGRVTALLEAAGRAGGLTHPDLARVYDAAVEERPAADGPLDVAYVIREWVDGSPLDALLVDEGPLEPAEALRLVTGAATAVAAAHAAGVGHGRLHPGNLILTPAGRLRITDTGLAAALAGGPPPSGEGDTRDLTAVLYALLTARWPDATGQPGGRLPGAGRRPDGRRYGPRQLRAGVPRPVDDLVRVGLDPAERPGQPVPARPAELALRLEQEQETAVRRAWRRARWLHRLPWMAAVVLLSATAIVTFLLGRQVGSLPGPAPGSGAPLGTVSPVGPPGG